jgi:hypothetical protein
LSVKFAKERLSKLKQNIKSSMLCSKKNEWFKKIKDAK